MSDTCKPLGWLGVPSPLTSDITSVVALDSNQPRLAAAGSTKVRLWDTDSGHLVHHMPAPDGWPVDQFCFDHEDSNILFLVSGSRIVRLELTSGRTNTLFEGRARGCQQVAGRPWLAVASGPSVRLVHDTQGTPIQTFKAHRADVYGISTVGDRLATASGKIARVFTGLTEASLSKPRSFKGANRPLVEVHFSANGTLLMGKDNRSNVYLWEVATGELLWHKASVWGPALTSRWVVGCRYLNAQDKTWALIAFELRTGEPLEHCPIPKPPHCLAASQDGALVAITTSKEYEVQLWSWTDKARLFTGVGHTNHICTVVRHPVHHTTLVTASRDATVAEWSLDDHTLNRHRRLDSIYGDTPIALSADGTWLACAEGLCARLRAWDSLAPAWVWDNDLNILKALVWVTHSILLLLCESKHKGYAQVFAVDQQGNALFGYDRVGFKPITAFPLDDGRIAVLGRGRVLLLNSDPWQVIGTIVFSCYNLPWCPTIPNRQEILAFIDACRLATIDVTTGTILRTFEPIDAITSAGALDEEVILVTDAQGTWHLLDRASGRIFRRVTPQFPDDVDPSKLRLHPLPPDRLATSWPNGQLAVWDMAAVRHTAPLTPPQQGVSPQLAELRSLLYTSPSAPTWNALCTLLDRWEGPLQLALDYAEPLLEDWPDTLRAIPGRWLARLLSGQRVPWARLARRVVLSNAFDAAMAPLAAAPELSQLVHLSLSGKGLRNAGALALAEATWPHLQSLSLHNTHIRINGCRALAQASFMRHLTALELGYSTFQDKGVAAFLGNCTMERLTSLRIMHCTSGQPPTFTKAFIQATHLGTLRTLVMNPKIHLHVEMFAEATWLCQLETLELHAPHHSPTIEGVTRLAQATHLASLRALKLDARLNNRDLEGLAGASFAPTLQQLHLHSWTTRHLSRDALDHMLAHMPNLDEASRQRLQRSS